MAFLFPLAAAGFPYLAFEEQISQIICFFLYYNILILIKLLINAV